MIAKIRNTFNNLSEKGLDKSWSNIEFVRGKMINCFILIYIMTPIPFFFVRFFIGDYKGSMINLFLISQLILAYFISIKKGHQKGAIYLLFVLLLFQIILIFDGVSITAFLYLASLPILFALLFKNSLYKNILFIISFLLILVYYFRHDGHISLVTNYIYIIGVSYFIISRFVRLIEENQNELNIVLEEKQLFIEKLHKRNKELEQFNHITSHDLQEPLKTINTYSDLLLNKKNNQLDQVSKDSLHFMNQAAHRMTGLIHDLFDHNRISNMSQLGSVNLQELVADINREFQQIAEEKKIHVLQEPLPIVIGYEKELRLLFQNLISNAIKFSKKQDNPLIKISAISKADNWLFTIEDNGIGIDTEDYGHIFKMFHRLQPKGNYAGNGAGLAHCHKVVELHQGKIWVDSVIGQGSSFHFTINKSLDKQVSSIYKSDLIQNQHTKSILSKRN